MAFAKLGVAMAANHVYGEKLPHDIIGGQPLKYHRTADARFVLYSVGWNEKDDGGVPGKAGAEGDWVWE